MADLENGSLSWLEEVMKDEAEKRAGAGWRGAS